MNIIDSFIFHSILFLAIIMSRESAHTLRVRLATPSAIILDKLWRLLCEYGLTTHGVCSIHVPWTAQSESIHWIYKELNYLSWFNNSCLKVWFSWMKITNCSKLLLHLNAVLSMDETRKHMFMLVRIYIEMLLLKLGHCYISTFQKECRDLLSHHF